MKCALCENKECYEGKDCTGGREEMKEAYNEDEKERMKVSTSIESDFYMEKTRLEELIEFGKRSEYERIGIAFCIGLEEEAEMLHKTLAKNFEVFSVCCKVGGIDKSEFELDRLRTEEGEGIEAMCNPVGQARVLNDNKTDLNVILGLCIGHDALFTEHSKAPVTTFAVKDRVLAHNPLGALYSSYHKKET